MHRHALPWTQFQAENPNLAILKNEREILGRDPQGVESGTHYLAGISRLLDSDIDDHGRGECRGFPDARIELGREFGVVIPFGRAPSDRARLPLQIGHAAIQVSELFPAGMYVDHHAIERVVVPILAGGGAGNVDSGVRRIENHLVVLEVRIQGVRVEGRLCHRKDKRKAERE